MSFEGINQGTDELWRSDFELIASRARFDVIEYVVASNYEGEDGLGYVILGSSDTKLLDQISVHCRVVVYLLG